MGSFSFLLLFVGVLFGRSYAQLSENFYDQTCPRLPNIVRREVKRAIETDIRAGAKLIRFHFHDCFVQVLYLNHYYSSIYLACDEHF